MRKVSHWSKSSERSVFERIQRHGCHYADVISERLLHISPIVVTVISRYRPRALFRETGNGISSSNGKPFDDRLRRGFHDRVYRSNSFPFPKKWPILPLRRPSYVNASKSTFSLEFEIYVEICEARARGTKEEKSGRSSTRSSSTRVENLTRLFY